MGNVFAWLVNPGLTRFGVSNYPWLAVVVGEGAKPANLDALATGQGIGHYIKNCVHRQIDITSRQLVKSACHTLNQV